MNTRPLLLSLFLLLLPLSGRAQWSLTTPGGTETEDFQTYRGGGFAPTPSAGQLDANAWRMTGFSEGSGVFGGTYASGDFARGTSTGGETTGGAYALDRSGDWAFMVQPGGSDWTPGTVTLRLQNNTGNTINQLDLSYVVGALNNEGRANDLTFSWSADDVSYTAVPSLDYVSPEASTGTVDGPYARSSSLTGLTWVNGAMFYLRWESDDVSGGGSRDELFLDDVSVTPFGSTIPCSTPTDQATALAFSGVTTTQVDGSFTAAASSPDGYLILAMLAPAAFTAPTDGVVYTPGDPLGAAIVLAAGSGTGFSHTGLTPGTEYAYAVYAYNDAACTGGPAYNATAPLAGNRFTLPANPTDLSVGCTTGTTLELSWTAPAGVYDGVVVALREDPTLVVHTLSGSETGFTASATFGSGTAFGATAPNSLVVYKGTGTSVTVTGLTPGATYQVKAETYVNDALWSGGTTTSGLAQVPDVSTALASPGNAQVSVSWTPPAGTCYDEVLVVARASSAVTATPTGDGSAYTANASFGAGTDLGSAQYAVYKGAGTSVSVTGLTNGTAYHFTLFVRNGSEWSPGVPVSATPNAATVLDRGDFVILAVNTQALPSGSTDQICFTAFRDITPFTAIDLTDNGFERLNALEWADTEGTIRLRRRGGTGTITAGTVMCLQGAGNDSTDFEIRVGGVNDDANWSVSSLNGGFSFDLNVNDQVWFLQNGGWVNPAGSHDATYTGNVLYGWTAIGWESAPGYNNTAGSTVPEGLDCFTTDVTGATFPDKVKYTGPTTAATQREWIARVNDEANWTDYADNTAYNGGSPDYWGAALPSLTILPGGFAEGVWEGTASSNWFDCGNWQNLDVPDASVNVSVSATAGNDPVIDAAAPFSDDYGDFARVADLTVALRELGLTGAGAVLEVNGDLTLSGTGALAFDAVNATELALYGDWVNLRDETAVSEGVGTVRFAGGDPATLSVQNGTFEVLHDIVLDKAFQIPLTLSADLRTTATGSVTLDGGVLETGTNALSVRNPAAGVLSGFEGFSPALPGLYANDAYVQGAVEREISGAGSYDFPVGAGPSAEGYARVRLDVTAGSGLVRAEYLAGSPGGISVNTTTFCGPTEFDVVYGALNDGFWRFAQTGGTPISYAITAYPNEDAGLTAPSLDGQYRLLKAPSGTEDWTAYALDGDPCTVSPGYYEVTGAGYTGFSDFAIGGGGTPLPVTLVDLAAVSAGDAVAVSWHTAAELNSGHFTVQRSADGLAWTAIGQVAAAGWSTEPRAYAFLDEAPLAGLSYYRLVQVDRDGGTEVSAPVAVERGVQAALLAWPNPTAGAVTVAGTTGAVTLELVDLTGRVLVVFAGTAADLSALPAGAYWLRVRDDTSVRVLPLHKR